MLIFGIDGCRPDALQAADTPALDSLAASGAYSFTAQTCRETKSGPSWASVLTGVWPDKHGVTNNSLEGEHFNEFPHFFSRLKSVSPGAFTASFVHWATIHDKMVRSADISNKYPSDVEVAAESVFLLQSACPDVIFLHFDEVDKAGHRNGYGPTIIPYLTAISVVDTLISRVLRAVQSRPTYDKEDWLFIATTDYGGSSHFEPGSQKARHGDNIPEHRTVFLILSGGRVLPGEISPAPTSIDLPPTVLSHLGIGVSGDWGWEGHAVGLT